MNEGKPAEIAEKMVTGRMKKFTGEISLTGQLSSWNRSKLLVKCLKSVAVCYNLQAPEVGEGIEKKEEDFAAEVAAQVAAAKGE